MTRRPLGTASIAGTGKSRPYPAYKDSGVEWLGETPAHWDVKKVTHVFSVGSETTPPTDHSVRGTG